MFIESVSILNFPIHIVIFRMHVGVVIFNREVFLKSDEMSNAFEIRDHFYKHGPVFWSWTNYADYWTKKCGPDLMTRPGRKRRNSR